MSFPARKAAQERYQAIQSLADESSRSHTVQRARDTVESGLRISDSLNLRHPIQAKRAKPERGEDKEKYEEYDPIYELTKGKGAGYLAKLRERVAERESTSSVPPAIREKNRANVVDIGKRFKTEIDSVTFYDDDEPKEVHYDITTTNESNGDNYYNNQVILPSGKMTAVNNHDGKKKAEEAQEIKQPSPPPNSAILWHQYEVAKEHYEANFQAKVEQPTRPISTIHRTTIENDQTLAVIWMVNRYEQPILPNTNDGMALLGTNNGKSSVWLLYDHLEEMDGFTEIDSVKLEDDDGEANMEIKYK